MNIADVVKQQSVAIRNLAKRVGLLQAGVGQAIQEVAAWLASRPPSITDEIDRIPGRRIEFRLSGEVEFNISAEGTRGEPVTFNVSSDGPFIMTHYPLVMWRTSAPEAATDFGMWRPVYTYPLPDQVVDTNIIDISWELFDGGSERLMQSAASAPLFSRPDSILPCPVPTKFSANASIQFFPTYNNIAFGGATPTTDGILHVTIPGYKIVNL